jgi:hypothetical protein
MLPERSHDTQPFIMASEVGGFVGATTDRITEEARNTARFAFSRTYAAFDNPHPPEVLYHYTSSDGLLGTIGNSRLHATDLRFMNDHRELGYAVSLAIEEARAYASRLDATHFARPLLESFADGYSKIIRNPQDKSWRYFGYCFCEEGDSPEHWRTYATQASGYSIGFSSEGLVQDMVVAGSKHPPMPLIKIIYDEERQRGILRTLFEELATRLPDAVNTASEQLMPKLEEELRNLLAASWITMALSFKHPSLKNEREWRLCVSAATPAAAIKPSFRHSRGMVVPYCELRPRRPATRLPIEEIVIGPTAVPLLGHLGARELLDAHGYNRVSDRLSSVPLRF